MKAQDYKDIKINNVGTAKIMADNEIWWECIDDTSGSPGPKRLKGGNLQAGFYGEVKASEFITGDELARRISLTAGISQFSNEPWLKFSYMGKVEFIAKKPFRNSISWDAINNVNAVFGSRMIKIGNHTYKVRLMKGKTEGKQNDSSSHRGVINHNSEWNKLMLPIHENAPSNWENKDNVNSPTENWNIGYTDKDLYTENNSWAASWSWCQEYAESTAYRIFRGFGDIDGSSSREPYTDSKTLSWRPVLELVD